LIAAHHLDEGAESRDEAYVIVDASCRSLHATDNVTWCLELPGMRERLRTAVFRFDRSETEDPGFMHWGIEVRITRLHGVGGTRYLACMAPRGPLRVLPETVLTPAQREVARCALTGATVAEMARLLNKRPGTVRNHLREIYRLLGVSSRVGLARTLNHN
jgi:DNA-binding CsgD family transcriptional regulator